MFFGASDDLVEMRGVVSDELDAYNGKTLRLSRSGVPLAAIDDEDEEVLAKHGVLDLVRERIRAAHVVEACWCKEKDGPSWTFESTVPHVTFDIREDNEVYCRGIVIDVRDLGPKEIPRVGAMNYGHD